MSSRPTTRPAFFPWLPSQLFMYVIVRLTLPLPPPRAQAATVSLSHGRGAGTPGPHRQHERFTGSLSRGGAGGGEMKRRHFSRFNLFFFFIRPQGGKKESLYHLHNSWNTQEKTCLWVVKKKSLDGVIVAREWGSDMYASLCALGPIFPSLSIHQCSPHTQSLSNVCH